MSFLTDCFWHLFIAYMTFRLWKATYLAVRFVYIWYLRPKQNLAEYKNTWTVVTGCTDGIGMAYTLELAKRGIEKFFLIGRNKDKLSLVQKTLENKFNCKVESAIFDFANDNMDDLQFELSSYEIGILVNCVGKATDRIAPLTQQPPNTASTIIKVNLLSAIKLMELIVPDMIERNKGIVVNISSITGWRPLPFLSSYPASKAALSFFTEALTDEYKKSNVKFQNLMPILVATNMTKYKSTEADGYLIVSPESFAKDAVDAIGVPTCTGSKSHEIQVILCSLCSFWLVKQFIVPFVILGNQKSRIEAEEKKAE